MVLFINMYYLYFYSSANEEAKLSEKEFVVKAVLRSEFASLKGTIGLPGVVTE